MYSNKEKRQHIYLLLEFKPWTYSKFNSWIPAHVFLGIVSANFTW